LRFRCLLPKDKNGEVNEKAAKQLRQFSLDLSGNLFCVAEIIANINAE